MKLFLSEEKIAIEKAKQVKPLYEIDIENFLEYFANKRYKNIEGRNEFFNSFINKVVLYDDHLVIFYNTNKRETKHLKVAETIDVLDDLEKEQKENSSKQKFKRVSTGCKRNSQIELNIYSVLAVLKIQVNY